MIDEDIFCWNLKSELQYIPLTCEEMLLKLRKYPNWKEGTTPPMMAVNSREKGNLEDWGKNVV